MLPGFRRLILYKCKFVSGYILKFKGSGVPGPILRKIEKILFILNFYVELHIYLF